MKKTLLLLVSSFMVVMLFAQERIIIQLQEKSSPKLFIADLNSEIQYEGVLFERLNIHLFQLPNIKAKKETLFASIQKHPLVKTAAWDEEIESRSTIPNDPFYPDQFALNIIQAPEAWDITTGGTTASGEEIVVGIVDQDFSITQSDIAENIWINPTEIANNGLDEDGNGLIDDINGWNFGNNSNTLSEGVHGTPITGIIGAKGNNAAGMAGINWNVKMALAQHNFRVSEIIASYGYFENLRRTYNETKGREGALVVAVNSSLGLRDPRICEVNDIWNIAQQAMGEVGILAINSAKNEPINSDEIGDTPSSCPSDFIISVLGTDQNDKKFSSSAFGNLTIDIGAPYDVLSSYPFDEYRNFGGNSSATPHVAGAIALLYSIPSQEFAAMITEQPAATALLIKDAILSSVDKITALEDYTSSDGRLNIFNSIRYLDALFNPNQAPTSELVITSLNPNPSNGSIEITYETQNFEPFPIRIFNAIGQLIYKNEINPCCFGKPSFSFNTSNWASGTYVVVMENGNNRAVERFVVY